MVNHPNRSKQQQPTHTPGPFRELTRIQLEELCLRQNQRVAALLAALKAARPYIGVGYFAVQRHAITSQVDAAIAKAEGR